MTTDTKKPTVTGRVDGNIFSVIGAASKALKKANQHKLAEEMTAKAFNAGSYDEALQVCMEYVDFDI